MCLNELYVAFPAVSEFQITQQALDRYEVLIELNVSAEEEANIRTTLRSYVRSAIPGDPEVVVRTTRFPKNSKFERYRTNC